MKAHLALFVALLSLPLSVFAGDVPLSYLVEEKPLKTAVTGTPLTFGIYTDNTCTTSLQSSPVSIDDVSVLSKLSLVTPKRGAKRPNTVEMRTTLYVVDYPGTLYLKVSGTGVMPVGGACQVQRSQDAVVVSPPLAGPAITVVDANGQAIGAYLVDVTQYYTSNVVVSTPDGLVEVALHGGYFSSDQGVYYFESNLCSGTPYALSRSFDPTDLQHPIGFIAGSLLLPPVTGTERTIRSTATDMTANCSTGGHRPVGNLCCCPSPDCTAEHTVTVGPLRTFETQGYATPFRLELRPVPLVH